MVRFSLVKNFQAGAPLIRRHNLMAFDATTGAILSSFAPVVDGEVTSVRRAPGGTAVFVGGKFKKVNGDAVSGLAKISVTTGRRFRSFRREHQRMGALHRRAGQPGLPRWHVHQRPVEWRAATSPRSTPRRARVDPNLNIPISQPIANSTFVQDLDVSAGGSRLVILGNFQNVGGRARSQLAVIALSPTHPATMVPWATNGYRPGVSAVTTPMYVRAVDISPDGKYFVVVSSGAWRGARPPVRHRGPLGARPNRPDQTDLGRVHGRRHADVGGGDGRGGLRRRTPTLDEQLEHARRRQRRTGSGESQRPCRPRPGERHGLLVEPRAEIVGAGVFDIVANNDRPLHRPRHRCRRRRVPPTGHASSLCAAA